MADNGTFLAAGKSLTHNSGTSGGATTINGAGTLKGNIVTTDNSASLTVEKDQGDGSSAVSYTHLTLPTIYSV